MKNRNQRTRYATAADTFDIDALISSLDARGANSSTWQPDAYAAMSAANDDTAKLAAA